MKLLVQWNLLIFWLTVRRAEQFAPSPHTQRSTLFASTLEKDLRIADRTRASKVPIWKIFASSVEKGGDGRRDPSSSIDVIDVALSPLEAWCIAHLDQLYTEALSIRCPFFKRRASDMLDGMDQIMRFLVIRHKSLPLVGPPAGWRCQDDKLVKSAHLSTQEILSVIRSDWKVENSKGYYITGRLNSTIYRDDCRFDGPDPDMPVRGLRKYLNAASQLFDPVQSKATLLSLEAVGPQISSSTPTRVSNEIMEDYEKTRIIAKWRISGVLRLPWRPTLPEMTGTTTYYRDKDGLIYKHMETWDVSMIEAFLGTFWPELAQNIWSLESTTDTLNP